MSQKSENSKRRKGEQKGNDDGSKYLAVVLEKLEKIELQIESGKDTQNRKDSNAKSVDSSRSSSKKTSKADKGKVESNKKQNTRVIYNQTINNSDQISNHSGYSGDDNKNSKKKRERPSKEERKKLKNLGNDDKPSTSSGVHNGSNPNMSEEQQQLLKQLQLMQRGKSNVQQNVPRVHRNSHSESKQRDERRYDKLRSQVAEVNMINQNIQKMIKVSVGQLGIIKGKAEVGTFSLVNENIKLGGLQNVPIQKTKIKEDQEIYRYSTAELYHLLPLATTEFFPILSKFRILRDKLPKLDEFLVDLLRAKTDEERLEMILSVAEKHKIINRLGGAEYEFNLVSNFFQQQQKPDDEKEPDTKRKQRYEEDEFNYIETLKRTAKNDEELTQKVYEMEFRKLFDEFLNDELKAKPLNDIVQHLIDNKFAHIVEGEIRVNAKNNAQAFVTHPKFMRDPCIHSVILRKSSMHGDLVKILVKETTNNEDIPEILDPSSDLDTSSSVQIDAETRTSSCVLEIIEKRHSRRCIGTIFGEPSAKCHKKKISFCPRDLKIPRMKIPTECAKSFRADENTLCVAEITGWKLENPYGKIVKVLGMKGELATENAAILLQNQLDATPFSQEIIDSLPSEDFVIPTEEFAYREDLRKKCIFSIDPETARDLDDAVSCDLLPNGNYEIGVHISDVSYFLKENSPLDEIVKDKATTIYLVDNVYHMLPVQLCLLCSLLPGADKMAYSVIWEINPENAEIISTRFTRSILNSCAKLSYDHAQKMIESENLDENEKFPTIYNGFDLARVADVVRKLQKIAVILRQKRQEGGAIAIHQPKISFKFDKDDQRMEAPVDFFQYCSKDSNRLIEEFMLLANISVAKFIYEKYPKVSLLRNHNAPNSTTVQKTLKNLEKHKIILDASSSTTISESMKKVVDSAEDKDGMNAAINLIVAKTLSRAKYFCSDTATEESDFWHFALSTPIYTHFTSPIRRYADVLVHRVLNAALGYEPETSRSPEEIQKLATVCNAQKYAAKLAGEDSVNLYFLHFIESLKSIMTKVAVIGIYDFNLEVVLIETGNVVKIFYKELVKQNIFVKPSTDCTPPYAIMESRNTKITKKVTFGSELKAKLEVVNGKLTINSIFL